MGPCAAQPPSSKTTNQIGIAARNARVTGIGEHRPGGGEPCSRIVKFDTATSVASATYTDQKYCLPAQCLTTKAETLLSQRGPSK